MEARDAAKTAVLEKLNDIKTKATADKRQIYFKTTLR